MSNNLSFIHTNSLAQALGLHQGELVSLVGGGGKTSLMFRLAQELAAGGKRVISTTTTRILSPSPEESGLVILENDAEALAIQAKEAIGNHRHITLARAYPDADKLKGLLPETMDYLHRLGLADYIINEADGAGCRPLKAPNPTEPVFPTSTTLVVAIVGIEAVGQPLLAENAFRIEYISRLTGLKEGEEITSEAVSLLLTHPEGIIQHSPLVRIIPFINKAGEDQVQQAETLAADILRRRHKYIDRVVFGEVRRPDYHLTVVFPEAGMVHTKTNPCGN